MDLLLLSNSMNHGSTMFSHAAEAVVELAAGDPVTFVPFALADWDDYADRVTQALGAFGVEVTSAHR
ncbi:MAG: Type 1 glutamine amidotransferase-like domain-containing protein, partial [Acidimicrobiales bacterium]